MACSPALIFAQKWISGEPTLDLRHSTLGGPRDGTLAEWMVIEQEGAVVPPSHLTDEECATLPCAAVTAWSALVTHGDLREGDVVLVTDKSGLQVPPRLLGVSQECQQPPKMMRFPLP